MNIIINMASSSKFKQFGLSPLITEEILKKGYKSPTPIQLKAIPHILKGRDLIATAQTGTGKTAAYVLPILNNLLNGGPVCSNQVRVLILLPTRELAVQVGESVALYSKQLPLRSIVVHGGVKINPQMQKLCRGIDVLIATPGRLLDLYRQNAVKFMNLDVLVLDEADKMLDLGFMDEIKQIFSILPKKRQNLLFSATFSDDVRRLANRFVKNPIEISISAPNSPTKMVNQWIYPVDKKKKSALLLFLIKKNNWQQVLIFCETKNRANKLSHFLENEGIKVSTIHGDKSQGTRNKALADFKQSLIQVLVATDIAARGLDINQLPQVVNFDLPKVSQNYIHRIGRTGRAGNTGQAISLVSADEFDYLSDIEHLIKKILVRKIVNGFEPTHDVPVSRLWKKDKKPKKPKKPKINKPDQTKNKKSSINKTSVSRKNIIKKKKSKK